MRHKLKLYEAPNSVKKIIIGDAGRIEDNIPLQRASINKTIYTSYFAKIARDYMEDKCFAISRGVPYRYGGKRYLDLAPSEGLLCLWKNISDYGWMRFAESYRKETLSKLDPWKVYDDIGEDSILVCWEGPGKMCHRHIVAEWMMENIEGLEVIEL